MVDLWSESALKSLKNIESLSEIEKYRHGLAIQPCYFESSEILPERYGSQNPLREILPVEMAKNLSPEKVNFFSFEISNFEQLAEVPLSANPIYLKGGHWGRRAENIEKLYSLKKEGQSFRWGIDPWAEHLSDGELNLWDYEWIQRGFLDSKESEIPKIFQFSSEIYHLAGATAWQELGLMLATIVQGREHMEGVLSFSEFLDAIVLQIPLGSQPLWGAAKIKSMRILCQRLQECVGENRPLSIEMIGCHSVNEFSRREIGHNLIRASLMAMGARLGGCTAFRHRDLAPWLGETEEGLRLSRNIGLVLDRESGLGQSGGALEGSYAISSWVEGLCEKSWGFFQEVLEKGGLIGGLQSGWLQEELRIGQAKELELFQRGKKIIVGVNHHIRLGEGLDKNKSENNPSSIASWWNLQADGEGNSCGTKIVSVKPLSLVSPLEILEGPLIESDLFFAKKQSRPEVFVYCAEESMDQSKVNRLGKILRRFGVVLKRTAQPEAGENQVIFCLGLDPMDGKWEEFHGEFQEHTSNSFIWYGDRPPEAFDVSWPLEVDFDVVFEWFAQFLGGSCGRN